MSKPAKTFLIIAAIMIMTGLVLSVAAFFSGNWHLSWDNGNLPILSDDSEQSPVSYEPQEYTVDAAGITRLDIGAVADDIIIQVNQDSNDIIVYYNNSKYHRYDVENTGNTLSISYHDLKHGLGFFELQRHIRPSQMEIWLPQSFFSEGNLDLELVSGGIELNGILGRSCDLKSVSGDIQLLDCSFSELIWYSVSGDILIRGGQGIATGESISGEATIENADFSELEIETVSGDINADFRGTSDDYSIDTDSVSGDIEADRGNDQAARHIDLETISGDIELDFISQ
jgi:hypothetical protein